MLSVLKYLLLLINIDQETILNWFGIENGNDIALYSNMYSSVEQTSTDISSNTFRLVVEGLWAKLQGGLSLSEIESLLTVILFVRFIILAIRYNLKTSFYITCIGLVAGYLWYRHLIDLMSMYRIVLLKLPWVNKLGSDGVELRTMSKQTYFKDLKFSDYAHWYNPGQVLYNGFIKGILSKQEGVNYYIDPVSMIVAKLPESMKSDISPTYYTIYKQVIPKIFGIFRKFWNQMSGIAAYVLITRIGKRYCPYLIRWHWTFLLVLGMVEQFVVNFIYRCYFFQMTVLLPDLRDFVEGYSTKTHFVPLPLQNTILNAFIGFTVIVHVGMIIFGLLHAIWGQYFYIPFLVENVELHIGPRPTQSIYSGGKTAWQNPEEKEKILNTNIPKLWYGWFGRGTKTSFDIGYTIRRLFKKISNSLEDFLRQINIL